MTTWKKILRTLLDSEGGGPGDDVVLVPELDHVAGAVINESVTAHSLFPPVKVLPTHPLGRDGLGWVV